ncbi:MAG: hypothetical protein PHY18_06110 [Dehalococcoidales bacterium]|nr:hypothetical protein [Dehalococcoidales bacterium]
MTDKSNKIVPIIIAAVIIGVVLVLYFAWYSPQTEEQKEEEIAVQPSIPETMKAGNVGEIEQGKTLAEVNPEAVNNPVRPPGSSIPAAVFDTKGEVVSIGENAVTVTGSGENFEDQKVRELTIKFTGQTITFEKGQQIKYGGLEGLSHLEIGQKILVSSSENIRGKMEFIAAYINKL